MVTVIIFAAVLWGITAILNPVLGAILGVTALVIGTALVAAYRLLRLAIRNRR